LVCSAGKKPSVPTTIVALPKKYFIHYSFSKCCWYGYAAGAMLHTNGGRFKKSNQGFKEYFVNLNTNQGKKISIFI
jgi:hypothetical protein